jgi:molybdopterin synthase sulfur carrier subunit
MSTRRILVLYFASLREGLGLESETIQLPEDISTLGQLRQWLCARGERWADKFSGSQRLMMAVNQEICRPDTVIGDGDEVAFFPPVTGG